MSTRHATRNPQHATRGQVFLEYAISLVGIVMLFYVISNVWVWMNKTMIQRHEAYQSTRWVAGQPPRAGVSVADHVYARLPIHLIGPAPTSPGSLPPYYNSDAWCQTDDQPLEWLEEARISAMSQNGQYNKAMSELTELQELSARINALKQERYDLQRRNNRINNRIDEIDAELAADPPPDPETAAALQAERDDLERERAANNRRIAEINVELVDAEAQADKLLTYEVPNAETHSGNAQADYNAEKENIDDALGACAWERRYGYKSDYYSY